VDEKELTAEIMRLHKLITEAAQRAKEESASFKVIDKLTSAQIRLELLLKKLRSRARR
jgi:hypothetical protein